MLIENIYSLGVFTQMDTELFARYKIEHQEKWREWCDKMPQLQFDSDWNVRIIPPFAGALTRFNITKGDKGVSVYFDAYSSLGWMYDENDKPIPYFEVYNNFSTQRYYLNETDKMMADIRDILNGGGKNENTL